MEILTALFIFHTVAHAFHLYHSEKQRRKIESLSSEIASLLDQISAVSLEIKTSPKTEIENQLSEILKKNEGTGSNISKGMKKYWINRKKKDAEKGIKAIRESLSAFKSGRVKRKYVRSGRFVKMKIEEPNHVIQLPYIENNKQFIR